MISNLLDISRADESGLAPHASDINLRALVDEVLAELAMSAWERDVELRSVFQTDRICADRDLLQRVLINLLENAIRHSPALASVTVTARRESQGTELRVVDAGRGVAPDFREKVFQPFVQAPTATPFASDPGCRGLGLTFCKVAAEAHGGRIWVEDAGPGAAFCVWLPDAA
jgi:signal transduction histidine kinase